jgi:signal transduction histidine kinase/DNA-binding response OmpR family regulator/HPt (histidine-containing phosphotransfer) domain-containing protein
LGDLSPQHGDFYLRRRSRGLSLEIILKSIFEKSRALNSVYAQMFIIVIAFVIMGTSSFFFASGMERKHLANDAEHMLASTEADINAVIMEPETYFSGYSETIRRMLIMNETTETISSYISAITNFLLNDNEHMAGFTNSHGYFFRPDGIYISGRDIILPENFNPMETTWFNAAVSLDGKTAISEPYTDFITGKKIITFSRYLKDEYGNPLCVFCLDIDFSNIFRRAIIANLTGGSYGVLINNRMEIIAHRESYFIGEKLYNINSGLAVLAAEMEKGLNINERRVKNYMSEDSIVYFLKIEHNWFLGIVIPIHEYYRSVNNMAAFLAIIGSIMATALCIMLYKITQAKMKSDIRTQQKSNFLATMSHEIRTPLNAILGMTEIQMQNASHPPSTSEAFIKINNSGNLLLNIINDILDLSKIESGKLELVPVKYEVASLINDIVQLNYIRFESKPIEFKLEIDENIPSMLVGDELRIKQILNNLLSNAFKFTDHGEVTLSACAECIGRGGAVLVTLVFQIKDTGQGMTPAQVSKLFDEYTRFNMEANRITEGAGLGMTITRNLIELMYGKINVKSAVGEGTEVTIRLPQRTDGVGIRGVIGKQVAENLKQFQLGNAIQIKKAQITHEHMPYGRVLIVDDVETNLYVAKGLMAPYGLKIDLATSGYEAIDKIKEGNLYDIIFMDHMMPKMDGIETAKLIREMGYSRPIVALTANALAGQAEVFLKNGFDGFVSKPIDIRQLNVSLNRLIRDKQPAEVVEAAQREKAELDKKTVAGNSKQIDPQLAEIFARDGEKAAAVLKSLLQNNLRDEEDIHMYIINVHAMKSALANIGESELSAAALRLEQAGREKDMTVMKAETNTFLDRLRGIIAKIKPKDADNEPSEDADEAIAFLREKLIIIREACAEFEKKTAKNALGELREKTWSHNTRELLNKIAEHLLHSEFDNAAALADEYIRKGAA